MRMMMMTTITFKNASMSPTAGMKSGLNGFSLCSKSIVCGVYLTDDQHHKIKTNKHLKVLIGKLP